MSQAQHRPLRSRPARVRPAWRRIYPWALVLSCAAGCVSGRVGGLCIYDDGLVVTDAVPQGGSVICETGRTARVSGRAAPTLRVTDWLVFSEPDWRTFSVRTSRHRPEQRIPERCRIQELRLFSRRDARTRPLAQPFDNADQALERVLLVGDQLYAEVIPRYYVAPIPNEPSYYAVELPNAVANAGAWRPISAAEGAQVFSPTRLPGPFQDARTTPAAPAATFEPRPDWRQIRTFDDLCRRGLNRGSWGELLERHREGRWEVVLRRAGAGRAESNEILLRQTISRESARAADVAGVPAP